MTAVLPGQAGMPVYTAKALSLLARHPAAGPVVFWHTGGMLDVVAAAQDVAR